MSHRTRQRDPGLLVATLLALSTGLAILLLAESLRAPVSPAQGGDPSASVDTAHRFYGAVNHALETGDAAPLRAIAGPSVVSHGSFSVTEDGRDVMVESILRLRVFTPGLRITVDWAAASSGGRVSVGLRTFGEETSSFAGLVSPFEARAGGWGPVEEIRIEDGRVVERWAGRADAFRLDELARVAVQPLPESSPRVLALVRLNLPSQPECPSSTAETGV